MLQKFLPVFTPSVSSLPRFWCLSRRLSEAIRHDAEEEVFLCRGHQRAMDKVLDCMFLSCMYNIIANVYHASDWIYLLKTWLYRIVWRKFFLSPTSFAVDNRVISDSTFLLSFALLSLYTGIQMLFRNNFKIKSQIAVFWLHWNLEKDSSIAGIMNLKKRSGKFDRK